MSTCDSFISRSPSEEPHGWHHVCVRVFRGWGVRSLWPDDRQAGGVGGGQICRLKEAALLFTSVQRKTKMHLLCMTWMITAKPEHPAGDAGLFSPVFRSWDWTLTLTFCWAFRATRSSRLETWAPASSHSTTLTSSLLLKPLRGKRCARRPWAWCCRRGNTRRSSHRIPLVRAYQHSRFITPLKPWCLGRIMCINVVFLQTCSLLLAPAAAGETTFGLTGTWPCSWETEVSSTGSLSPPSVLEGVKF